MYDACIVYFRPVKKKEPSWIKNLVNILCNLSDKHCGISWRIEVKVYFYIWVYVLCGKTCCRGARLVGGASCSKRCWWWGKKLPGEVSGTCYQSPINPRTVDTQPGHSRTLSEHTGALGITMYNYIPEGSCCQSNGSYHHLDPAWECTSMLLWSPHSMYIPLTHPVLREDGGSANHRKHYVS